MHLRECLVIYHELQDKRGVAKTLDVFTRIALARDEPLRAATLIGAVDTIRVLIGATPRLTDDELAVATRTALGDVAFTAATREGRNLAPDDVVEYALQTNDIC
jgi:hypothetical protein